MLFNSIHFLIFFTALFIVYYSITPDRHRPKLLLLASCYFYMAYIPKFILILFFIIVADFFLAHWIERSVGQKRRLFLIASIAVNIGTLFFFKYFNFFSENVAALAQLFHWNYSVTLLQVALPLGLSFHVFQSLSYVIEVYRGKQKPEHNIGIYALYVMFFSQLVAGPIERPGHMLPQFHKSHPFDPFKVRQGLELMIWGFFKKLVIADKIALLVDYSHAKIQDTSGSMLIFTTILFSYQLYADFSGYSDIALGSALVFGYDLTVNFNRPFASRSIAEFWRRWHISLSSWLRDYLYHPLVFSGKQVTKLRIYLSMFLTFALIGLWHGANWTYVVFGALHGAYLVVSLLTANIRKKIVAFLRLDKVPALHYLLQVVSMFVLVSVSLVFFRSATVSEALLILSKMGNAVLHLRQSLHGLSISSIEEELGTTVRTISAILAAIVFLEAIQYWQGKKGTHFLFDRANRFIRYAWYYTLILSILRFGYLGASAFIYFKF